MINETFLRQSVRDLNNEINVYIYNDKFIDVIAERYYEKYKKTLYLEKKRGIGQRQPFIFARSVNYTGFDETGKETKTYLTQVINLLNWSQI